MLNDNSLQIEYGMCFLACHDVVHRHDLNEILQDLEFIWLVSHVCPVIPFPLIQYAANCLYATSYLIHNYPDELCIHIHDRSIVFLYICIVPIELKWGCIWDNELSILNDADNRQAIAIFTWWTTDSYKTFSSPKDYIWGFGTNSIVKRWISRMVDTNIRMTCF